MSRSSYSRRAVIAAAGSALIAGGTINRYAEPKILTQGREPEQDSTLSRMDYLAEQQVAPNVVTVRDRETLYPLATYNNRTGWYDITMPVNVRFDLTDSEYGIAAIEELLGIQNSWTQIVATVGSYWPESDAKPPDVWDSIHGRLVAPIANYRKAIGPLDEGLCYHVYLWPVQVEGELVGVVAQTHKDVGSIRDHIGTNFDEAAMELSSLYETEGWTVVNTEFDTDVSTGLRDFWGLTGDRIISPPET